MNLASPPTEVPVNTDDLRALAWVQDELRRSLETAHKALRRQLKEGEALGGSDVAAVDPSVLRGARTHLHQGAGALELIGLPAAARVLRASEVAVQRMSAKPALFREPAIELIERASFGVLDYLARLLAGKATSPIALFPQYRAVQELAGADRVHPADLWDQEWHWHELPDEAGVQPRAIDAESRAAMESLMLALMRQPDRRSMHRMSDLCAALGAGSAGRPSTLWKLAAAMFEAQAAGLLHADVYAKRVVPRLLAQARAGAHPTDVSERLACDLLFFCARAEEPSMARPAPRLVAVREAWRLRGAAVPDYESSRLGRFDPAWIAQARKRVAGARDVWSAVAGGEMHRLHVLGEQFALVSESIQRLYPSGDRLSEALMAAVAQTVQSGGPPPAPLAMEVATSVLYLEASLEQGDLDDPELGDRVQRLAQRVNAVRRGDEPQPLDTWMEELYRRVSDRQTMGSVVQELRASLSDVEKQIDQYFRNPSQREVLIPVPAQLSAMRGVLSVLGLDQASQAVVHMRDEVDALAQTEVDPQLAVRAGTFDRLADNLGALSFLIDMLSVQPQMAKSLFSYDPDSGSLRAVMGRVDRPTAFDEYESTPEPAEPRLIDRAQQLAQDAAGTEVPDDVLSGDLGRLAQQALLADERALADTMTTAQVALAHAAGEDERRALRSELAQAMTDIVAPPVHPPAPAPAPLPAPGDDAEMREVFIEEAREVVQESRAAVARLAAPDADHGSDIEDMTEVRRAFHTLKGSSRMVGLGEFGAAAWACEQVYNSRLAQAAPMDDALHSFTSQALHYLGDWIEAIARGHDEGHRPEPVVASADAMRIDGRLEPIRVPAAQVAIPEAEGAATTLAERVPDLPLASDLDLVDLPARAVDETAIEALPVPQSDEVAYALDLEALSDALGDEEPVEAAIEAAAPLAPPEVMEIDLDAFELAAEPEPEPEAVEAPEEQVKVIGPLRIDITMFNIYLNEADELSRRLSIDLAEWATDPQGPPGENAVVLAHSLAGSSGTVGFTELSVLGRALEHALMRSNEARRVTPGEPELYQDAADEIRRLLHQFAAGFLKSTQPGLVQRLNDHQPVPEPAAQAVAEPAPAGAAEEPEAEVAPVAMAALAPPTQQPPEAEPIGAVSGEAEEPAPLPAGRSWTALEASPAAAPIGAARADAFDGADDIDVTDSIDPDLFPIFADEAGDLLPQLQSRMRDWARHPSEAAAAAACMRTLHTFKGGARLAGAMRLGEMAHRLETAIEHLLARGETQPPDIEPLVARVDAIESGFDELRAPESAAALAVEPVRAPEASVGVSEAPAGAAVPGPALPLVEPIEATASDAFHESAPIDWSRFSDARPSALTSHDRAGPSGTAAVRVRAPLLDRLVNQAGEVSIARARIEADVGQLKSALADLTENLERLRHQMRAIELQAESQISSRMEAAKAAAQAFDPLEMDRFTRFQELTRMMAESVNDVATVQRSLQRTVQSTEDELAAQARLTRGLQDDLLRTRMVEFESLSDRLYRVVRQAAKETAKQVRLDIVGGSIEIDRGVLDRMSAPFEHLLRNSVTHGIEPPAQRAAAGKDEIGNVVISLAQEGNEVTLEFRDDGAGLDLERIRDRAVAAGLIAADARPSESELADLIFMPGFSTAASVTELSGRGVGMDVVRSEVVSMGGRIETASAPERGTCFRLVLPLTTAVTQVVLLRCGESTVAVPSTLVEQVRRAGAEEIEGAYASGTLRSGDATLPFFWFGALLQGAPRGGTGGRSQTVVVIRSASQRVALHVDEVVGHQEVVVKNLGPQLSRLPGLAGMTLLPSGAVAPIYNPVALATLYGDAVRARLRAASSAGGLQLVTPQVPIEPPPPLVLVVDDSLTVRRVTQRLLAREGYRVVTAKDGLDALERLAEEKPAVVLSDIEMPRMDGFDLVRNLRADARLADLAVIMITSRIAQKHRDHASELGVNHYLGKPYGEEELLSLVARYARRSPEQ